MGNLCGVFENALMESNEKIKIDRNRSGGPGIVSQSSSYDNTGRPGKRCFVTYLHYFSLRGLKNSLLPIIRPSKCKQTILLKSVKWFRKIFVTNTVTLCVCVILHYFDSA